MVAFQEYIQLFAVGLSDDHCLAIQKLFDGRFDSKVQSCILKDKEFMAASNEQLSEDQLVDGTHLV